MATPVGAQGHLGLRKEASFASGGAVDNWLPINSENVSLNQANVYSDRVRNTSEQVGGQVGLRSVAGDINLPVSPKWATQILQCAIGGTSSPFAPARPLNSMLFQIDHETAAIQVSGCMAASLGFSSTQGGELLAVLGIEGKGLANVAAGSPSYTASDNPYLHHEASFQLNGVADTNITDWNLTINNNLVTDLYGTGTMRVDIPAGKCLVTGSFTKLFTDVTERNAFLNSQVRSFWVKFLRGSNFLTLFCPTVRYDSHTENIGGQSEYILETFNFTAYVDDPATENSIRVSGDFS